MRSRNIKPSLFKNEMLGVADPILTVVFAGLWCAADREGRIEDRPLRLKAEILPYRENIDFNVYLTELERLEFICRYTVENISVIQVINFKKHQNPHKTEKASELPKMPLKSDGCKITVKDTLNNGSRPADSLFLIPDSLIPDIKEKTKSKSKKFDPSSFRPAFISEKSWTDLIALRKAKKAAQTERAYQAIIDEILKAVEAGFTADDCINKMCNRNWTGFEAAWMENDKNQQSRGNGRMTTKERDALELLGEM